MGLFCVKIWGEIVQKLISGAFILVHYVLLCIDYQFLQFDALDIQTATSKEGITNEGSYPDEWFVYDK